MAQTKNNRIEARATKDQGGARKGQSERGKNTMANYNGPTFYLFRIMADGKEYIYIERRNIYKFEKHEQDSTEAMVTRRGD